MAEQFPNNPAENAHKRSHYAGPTRWPPAAFGKLTSPTNLHQISTGDPSSLFHSKISFILDSYFPPGASPIPLVLNDCSPSCMSASEVNVVFRKLRGGKAPGIDLIDYAI
ncbi:hypothetical protein TNCV_460561 [Trichonephila clavipes]|nr:hypothetical protein TNCV_460561 [Trichonephila clavipes]